MKSRGDERRADEEERAERADEQVKERTNERRRKRRTEEERREEESRERLQRLVYKRSPSACILYQFLFGVSRRRKTSCSWTPRTHQHRHCQDDRRRRHRSYNHGLCPKRISPSRHFSLSSTAAARALSLSCSRFPLPTDVSSRAMAARVCAQHPGRGIVRHSSAPSAS